MAAQPPNAASRPQPAPRLSIAKSPLHLNSPTASCSSSGGPSTSRHLNMPDMSFNSTTGYPDSSSSFQLNSSEEAPPLPSLPSNEHIMDLLMATTSDQQQQQRGPPPLPPKPKVLPIKPSNWGHSSATSAANVSGGSTKSPTSSPVKEAPHCVPYLDEPSSSFV